MIQMPRLPDKAQAARLMYHIQQLCCTIWVSHFDNILLASRSPRKWRLELFPAS